MVDDVYNVIGEDITIAEEKDKDDLDNQTRLTCS